MPFDYRNWTTGPQEEFSSQGPTNAWAGSQARIKPDIIPDVEVFIEADINDDGRIGLQEAVHAMQAAAGLRDQ